MNSITRLGAENLEKQIEAHRSDRCDSETMSLFVPHKTSDRVQNPFEAEVRHFK